MGRVPPNDLIRLPVDASDEDILERVRRWVGLLAQERYQDAYHALYHPPWDRMTPQIMEQLIHNYGFVPDPGEERGATYKVTPVETALRPAHPLNQDKEPVQRWRVGTGAIPTSAGIVHFDLPLNGEWSDLTAIFTLYEIDSSLVLSLDDLHVL